MNVLFTQTAPWQRRQCGWLRWLCALERKNAAYLLEGRIQPDNVWVVQLHMQPSLSHELVLTDLMQQVWLVDLERYRLTRMPAAGTLQGKDEEAKSTEVNAVFLCRSHLQ